jgi:hypothetical protein
MAARPALATEMGFSVSALEGSTTEVWCVTHGKRLPQAYCHQPTGTFFTCTDPAACATGTLEPVPSLLSKGCVQLSCAIHGRIRRTRFMQIGADGSSYDCIDAHACVTRRPREAAQATAEDEADQ